MPASRHFPNFTLHWPISDPVTKFKRAKEGRVRVCVREREEKDIIGGVLPRVADSMLQNDFPGGRRTLRSEWKMFIWWSRQDAPHIQKKLPAILDPFAYHSSS